MNPCAGDWGGSPNERVTSVVSVTWDWGSVFPSSTIIKESPGYASVKLYWQFKNSSVYKWQWNVGFWFCFLVDGVLVRTTQLSAYSIGMSNVAQGNYTFTIPVPDMSEGAHTVTIEAIAVASYLKSGVGELVWSSNSYPYSVYVVSGLPQAAFSISPLTGYAPLDVQFTDNSAVYDPTDPNMQIRSWLWNFGDGQTSQLQSPDHLYTKPGVYTVTLTVVNAYGSDKVSDVVQVFAGPVHPIFDAASWFPDSTDAGGSIQPKLYIDNQGGAGNVDLWFICQGQKVYVWQSKAITGYTNMIDVGLPSKPVSYYLGYVPTQSMFVTITFYVGPAGLDYTHTFSKYFQVTVSGGGGGGGGGGGTGLSAPLVIGGVAVAAGVLYLVTRRGK
jgi:PKD repeat protein